MTKQPKRRLQPYGRRNDRIRKMGIGFDYKSYLASDLWKSIRTRVLERDRHTCRICGEPAYTAHHTNYRKSVLSGECLNSIFAICRACHKFIEFDRDGNKLHIREVGKRVYLLCHLKGKHGYNPVAENIANSRT